jgi:hypothetical protein
VSIQEKTQSTVPGGKAAPFFFSAWERLRARIFPGQPFAGLHAQPSLSRDFPRQDCTPELHGILDLLQSIRKRILTNSVLGGWTVWAVWIMLGLIVTLAISPKLLLAMVVAAILAVAGTGAILLWTWRGRLSTYQTACRLDSAAGLQDRVSTAIYLGDTKNSCDMVKRQRGDALARIAKLDPLGFFPVRVPIGARRALALFLVVAVLYVYRLHHQPPLLSLLRTASRSPLVQSIVAPLVNAMEKDLQRTLALVTTKADILSDETRQSDTALSGDNLWQSNDNKGEDPKEAQDALATADNATPQDQIQPPADQNPSTEGSPQQGNENPQSQDGKNPGENSANNSQKASSQGSQKSSESLTQSLMQALKSMMASAPNQKSNDRGNQSSQPDSQGAPQSGNSHQPGTSDSEKQGDSRGTSDAKQKATQSASNGAGSQAGMKDLRQELDSHPVNAVPDRVALESSGFKEQTRMRVDTETGASQMAVRDSSPQAQAVINGAEQENIPARYRLYVQRYFEHADNSKP